MLSPFARALLRSGVLDQGARVLAACSGGADSVALLLGLDELGRAGRLHAEVAHVHHGLRPEASRDLALVRDLSASLGLPFHHRERDAAAVGAQRRRGIEEAARAVRREALEEIREDAGLDVIALAHSADDQAETVLLRLFRGSGAEGLGGMSARDGRLVRPMLAMRRADVRAVAAAAGVAWASDPTNWSPSSARSLVRELLGRLEDSLDERVVERLCETADQLREESRALDEQAVALLRDRLVRERGAEGVPRAVVRDADGIGAAPAALRRRAVRRLLRELRPGEPPPSADAVRRASRLFEPAPRPQNALLPGVVLRRAGRDVVAGPEAPWRAPSEPVPLPAAATLAWNGGRLALGAGAEGDANGHRHVITIDGAAIGSGLAVRTRRPGDAVATARGSARVSSLLAEAGVPAAWRDAHPVVCLLDDAATIVWLAGSEADPRFLAAAGCTRPLALSWTPAIAPGGVPEQSR